MLLIEQPVIVYSTSIESKLSSVPVVASGLVLLLVPVRWEE